VIKAAFWLLIATQVKQKKNLNENQQNEYFLNPDNINNSDDHKNKSAEGIHIQKKRGIYIYIYISNYYILGFVLFPHIINFDIVFNFGGFFLSLPRD